MKTIGHKVLPLAILLGVAAGLVHGGAVTVQFQDGRSLEVQSAEIRGELAWLTLPDGDQMTVPAWRVTSVDEIVEPQQAVAAVANVPVSDAWQVEAGELAHLFAASAERHQVDPILLAAMAGVESSFDPAAVSHKGASGLMQLMPATAERFGVNDVFDVGENIEGGAAYMSWLLERYEGRLDLALAGYNAGENAVDRYEGVPPYPETRDYIEKVVARAERLGSVVEWLP